MTVKLMDNLLAVGRGDVGETGVTLGGAEHDCLVVGQLLGANEETWSDWSDKSDDGTDEGEFQSHGEW